MGGSRRTVLAVAATGVGILVFGMGTLARSRQATRERQLVVAWKHMGQSLVSAAGRLGLDAHRAPDAWELAVAPSDTQVQARVDSLETRIWKELTERQREPGMDSLREVLRRDRERLGLALAHCREGTRSFPSRWFLAGFPMR